MITCKRSLIFFVDDNPLMLTAGHMNSFRGIDLLNSFNCNARVTNSFLPWSHHNSLCNNNVSDSLSDMLTSILSDRNRMCLQYPKHLLLNISVILSWGKFSRKKWLFFKSESDLIRSELTVPTRTWPTFLAIYRCYNNNNKGTRIQAFIFSSQFHHTIVGLEFPLRCARLSGCQHYAITGYRTLRVRITRSNLSSARRGTRIKWPQEGFEKPSLTLKTPSSFLPRAIEAVCCFKIHSTESRARTRRLGRIQLMSTVWFNGPFDFLALEPLYGSWTYLMFSEYKCVCEITAWRSNVTAALTAQRQLAHADRTFRKLSFFSPMTPQLKRSFNKSLSEFSYPSDIYEIWH